MFGNCRFAVINFGQALTKSYYDKGALDDLLASLVCLGPLERHMFEQNKLVLLICTYRLRLLKPAGL